MGVKYFESVMDYFKEISAIPRCSQQEEKISDYLLQFAKVKKLEAYRDDMLNVIIKKPATPGYEKSPTVILQGHMDMVCEKNKGMDHDFEKDPIKIVIDGDLLKAEGTTLGADNGIAVAFCLAILDAKDIPHPPLEVLITSQEEVGLLGASALDASKLQGKILINIDAEYEGVLFTSCAGGVRSAITLPILWKEATGDAIYEIKIGGLKGGHSGMEIDKHRANANKLLGRVLKDIFEACDIDIASVSGGMKVNAIPREAAAQITFDEGLYPLVAEKIAAWDRLLKNELKSSDKGMSLTLEKMDGS
ncbi:MAG: beta-Ala-His dipeptidase, partial [Clostridia bacterium]|nr:beta-Ala-His dipeptidase [Clostridia bacterium]